MAIRALVTGADGFIGSHLTELLVRRGFEVRAFCYYNSFGSRGWLDSIADSVAQHIDFFMGDIRDPNGVRKALQGVDVVFHLAALIGIPFSYHSPDSYVDTNIKGTLNVLTAAKELMTERLLVTSTSEVYGTAKYVPMDENHPYAGQSPYSATKIGADRLAESFHRSFGLPVTIVRPFNTYGPRQSARAVIPTIITQLLSGATQLKLGNLYSTRDFNYVADIARAFLELSRCESSVGEEVNVASSTEISIGALADKLIALTGSSAAVVCDEQRLRPADSEVERLFGDNTKIKRLIGYAPDYDLDTGLTNTIEWLRGNLSRYRPELYNV